MTDYRLSPERKLGFTLAKWSVLATLALICLIRYLETPTEAQRASQEVKQARAELDATRASLKASQSFEAYFRAKAGGK